MTDLESAGRAAGRPRPLSPEKPEPNRGQAEKSHCITKYRNQSRLKAHAPPPSSLAPTGGCDLVEGAAASSACDPYHLVSAQCGPDPEPENMSGSSSAQCGADPEPENISGLLWFRTEETENTSDNRGNPFTCTSEGPQTVTYFGVCHGKYK